MERLLALALLEQLAPGGAGGVTSSFGPTPNAGRDAGTLAAVHGPSDRGLTIADVVGLVALNVMTGSFNLVAGIHPGIEVEPDGSEAKVGAWGRRPTGRA